MSSYSVTTTPHRHGIHCVAINGMANNITYDRTRQLVLSAGPNADIKDNILNVFGSKQVS